jgi:regulatory protein
VRTSQAQPGSASPAAGPPRAAEPAEPEEAETHEVEPQSAETEEAAPESAEPRPAESELAETEEVARQVCLRMLTTMPRTRAQLAAALRRRGVPDEAADAVLARFADVGLIDDAMFARAWVESRHHGRGLAGRALAAELRRRGVPAPDIEAAVDQLDPEQEIATARGLVSRGLASPSRSLPARVRRVVCMLARKGYPPALAFRLVGDALERQGVDPAAAGLDLAAAAEAAEAAEAEEAE